MRHLKKLGLGALVLLTLSAGTAGLMLRASLPVLDGERALEGLSAPVLVERDESGVVTLTGDDRADLAQALGFAHAQDRFFQMDLSRRMSSGTLSALFGATALETDRVNRLHRFAGLADTIVGQLPGDELRVMEAYARGVNQGLQALDGRSFEYWLLGQAPEPWQSRDSVLVLFSMFMELNDDTGRDEALRVAIAGAYPPAVARFLQPAGGPWDAPVAGEARQAPAIPGPELMDLRSRPVRQAGVRPRGDWAESPVEPVVGSNNWAVAGWRSASGKAMVANDMHLGIRVPNTWYRARLRQAGQVDVTGVTLPGLPAVVAGSNGRVAWGFTNSYGDWVDLVALEIDPADPDRYRVPEGWEHFEIHEERIRVKGGEDSLLPVRQTRWGPVVEFFGRHYALAWTAHHPEASNLALLGMERAGSVEEAVAIANRSGTPPQNMVVADTEGNIGWTVMGRIPRRGEKGDWEAASGTRPETLWQGWLDPADYPRLVNPESGVIWTANTRVVDGEDLAKVGDGGYALGARGRQIRDRLLAVERPGMDDMLAIQLDDEALFLAPWRELILSLAPGQALAANPARAHFVELVRDWTPRASVDSVGYRLVRAYRYAVLEAVFASLAGELIAEHPDERIRASAQFEASLWQLVTARPPHLLDPAFADWDAFFLSTLDTLIAELAKHDGGDLSRLSWGQFNRAAIRHPLSGALPGLNGLLDMPDEPLAGDQHMPRVQGASFGASERFGVAPGALSESYFHMPGGQSGHPLSDFYSRGHDLWVTGQPAGFLPGPARHTLKLQPAPR